MGLSAMSDDIDAFMFLDADDHFTWKNGSNDSIL